MLKTGKISELTGLEAELQRVTGTNSLHFEDHLELYYTGSSYAIPDVVAFKIDPITGQAIKAEGYWVEFKVVESSPYTPNNQVPLFNNHIGNGSPLRIRTKNPGGGLIQGDIIQLKGVIQVSTTENGLRAWQVK